MNAILYGTPNPNKCSSEHYANESVKLMLKLR